jgi:hypothetical protein
VQLPQRLHKIQFCYGCSISNIIHQNLNVALAKVINGKGKYPTSQRAKVRKEANCDWKSKQKEFTKKKSSLI